MEANPGASAAEAAFGQRAQFWLQVSRSKVTRRQVRLAEYAREVPFQERVFRRAVLIGSRTVPCSLISSPETFGKCWKKY